MPQSTGRTKLLWVSACAFGAALPLSACGDHGAKQGGHRKGASPAAPAPDPKRAARVNGVGPDGKPIDAVQAAEMDLAKLPPLPEVDYAKEFGPAPAPPPYRRPEESAPASK
jgi:hypothetical protein